MRTILRDLRFALRRLRKRRDPAVAGLEVVDVRVRHVAGIRIVRGIQEHEVELETVMLAAPTAPDERLAPAS